MIERLARRLRREEGSALVTALVLITVMTGVGLALYKLSDNQQLQSGQERVRESAFGVAEAALNAQLFQLGSKFPMSSGQAYPATCTPSSTSTTPCPTGSSLTSAYTGGDYAATCNGAAVTPWTTTVRDNGGGSSQFYSAAVVNTQPTYDANGDGAVWVRADGWAGCRQRSMVQLVKAGLIQVAWPRNVLTANWFQTTNQGRKVIIDTKGTSAQAAGVSVRCTGLTDSSCMKYDKAKGQVSPDTTLKDTSPSPLLSASQLATLAARAQALGTYYKAGTCPPTLTGAMVYVEDLTPCGSYPGGNTAANPGMLIVDKGTLSLGGNSLFYGVVYMRNLQAATGAVVSLQGTAGIVGSVAVDGNGGVSAGSSKLNLVFSDSAQSLVTGLGTAAAVPNTWRELLKGQ